VRHPPPTSSSAIAAEVKGRVTCHRTQRDFLPCATVIRHRIDMVKSPSETKITVRNERSIESQVGNKNTSSNPAKKCSPRRILAASQNALLPHAGRRENTIAPNCNRMYSATANHPTTGWKCSSTAAPATANPKINVIVTHVGRCRGRRLLLVDMGGWPTFRRQYNPGNVHVVAI